MTPLDSAWHLLNALAAPFGVALLSVVGFKLFWRAQAPGTSTAALLVWSYLAALLAYAGAWAYTGAEGSMLGYALMVASIAVALWLRGFILRA